MCSFSLDPMVLLDSPIYSGEDKGRACRAQQDHKFSKIIFFFADNGRKIIPYVEHFIEIINLLNDIVSKPYPLPPTPMLNRALSF